MALVEEGGDVAERGTVPQRTARAMMREALRRSLLPGDRLASEPTLMSYFKVSRGSLREALRVLAFLGAIEIRPGPGGGPRIAMPQPQVVGSSLAMALQFRGATLRTLLEARAAMEPSIAELAAVRRRDDDLAALEVCVLRLEEAVGTEGFTRPNHQFHQLLAVAAGNEALTLLVAALTSMSRAVDWRYDRPTQERIAREKKAIVGALQAREEACARDLTVAMFAGVLDDPRNAEHLSARVVWADVDELIHDSEEQNYPKDNAKGDTKWMSA